MIFGLEIEMTVVLKITLMLSSTYTPLTVKYMFSNLACLGNTLGSVNLTNASKLTTAASPGLSKAVLVSSSLQQIRIFK